MSRTPRHALHPSAAALTLTLLFLCAPPVPASSDAGEPLTDFHREWVWSTFGRQVGRGGLEIVDVDSDARMDILATSDTDEWGYDPEARWSQIQYAGTIRQVWSSTSYPSGLRFLKTALVQGLRQIAAVTDDSVTLYDGRTKAELGSFPIAATEVSAAELDDVDGDGDIELLACDSGALFVYDLASGAQVAVKWGFGCTDLSTGQADSDGAREIALAGNSFGGFVLDGITLAVDWATVSGFGDRVRLSDVDQDGIDEVVCGSDYTPLRAIDPATGQLIWQAAVDQLAVLETVDVDGDGDREVVYAGPDSGDVHALDEGTGTEVWQVQDPEARQVHAIAAGDPDNDGDLELILGRGSNSGEGSLLLAVDLTSLTVEAVSADFRAPIPAVEVVDLEGDSTLELVTSCSDFESDYDSHGRVLVFDVGSRMLEYVGPPVPATAYESVIRRLVAAQLDGDPPLEICIAYGYYDEYTLSCEDGLTHETQWALSFPEYVYPASLASLDLDGIPGEELLAGTDDPSIYAFEGETGWLLWATPALGVYGSFTTLRHGDVVGDTDPEIIGSGVEEYGYQPIAAFDLATGGLVAGPYDGYPGITTFDITELDGGGASEVICGSTNQELAEYDMEIGQFGSVVAPLGGTPRALRIGDVTRDGVSDFVFVLEGRIRVWGGGENSLVWTSDFLGDGVAAEDTLWIGNYDADGVPEIAVSTRFGFAIFEAPLYELFVDGFESGDTSAWSSTQP